MLKLNLNQTKSIPSRTRASVIQLIARRGVFTQKPRGDGRNKDFSHNYRPQESGGEKNLGLDAMHSKRISMYKIRYI